MRKFTTYFVSYFKGIDNKTFLIAWHSSFNKRNLFGILLIYFFLFFYSFWYVLWFIFWVSIGKKSKPPRVLAKNTVLSMQKIHEPADVVSNQCTIDSKLNEIGQLRSPTVKTISSPRVRIFYMILTWNH